jgi:branched-chain amino acid transport system permease protein
MTSTVLRLIPAAAFVLFVAMAPSTLGDGTLHFFTEMFIVLILASMWNLLAGYAGLMSLGHQAFFGIGGYAVYLFSNGTGLHPFIGLPVAVIAATLAAMIVAPLLFRLRDAYLAIGSWVLAEIAAIAVQKTEWLGGITGLSLATIGEIDFEAFEANCFRFAALAVFISVCGGYLILRSRLGLALMSVRDNETAAAAIGVDVWKNRFAAFLVSAAGCGLAGGISLLNGLAVQPGNAFSPEWTVIMTFVVIVGGIGTLEGPIVGTIVYFALRELLTVFLPLTGTWYLVAMGIVAILTMLYAPQGLWPLLRNRLGIDWLSLERRMPARREVAGAEGEVRGV